MKPRARKKAIAMSLRAGRGTGRTRFKLGPLGSRFTVWMRDGLGCAEASLCQQERAGECQAGDCSAATVQAVPRRALGGARQVETPADDSVGEPTNGSGAVERGPEGARMSLSRGPPHQGISDANAANAWGKVSVEVAMAAPRPIMATAPSGSGCEIGGKRCVRPRVALGASMRQQQGCKVVDRPEARRALSGRQDSTFPGQCTGAHLLALNHAVSPGLTTRIEPSRE